MIPTNDCRIVVTFSKLTSAQFAFLATPFSIEFNGICADVTKAIVNEGLVVKRTDETPESGNFISDIRNMIRQAKLVVAICSPMPTLGVCNQNVMYELGFAQSIGKATLILSNSIKSLPVDLDTQHVFEYSDADIGKKSLNSDLRIAIKNITRRITNDITDSDYAEVSIAPNMDLFKGILSILEIAKRVHSGFQQLDIVYLSRLQNDASGLALEERAAERQKKLFELSTAWNNYNSLKQSINLISLDVELVSVQPLFKVFINSKDSPAHDPLKSAADFHSQLVKNIFDFKQKNNAVTTYIEKLIGDDSHQASLYTKVWQMFDDLVRTTKAITVHADGMIVNLTDAMLKLMEQP